ncbi:MAG: hypothetical protein Q7J82_06735 [Coriobacteriia bacterium]|nr:hypothetical protein [Coriobacteriia bacterium]
MKTRLLLTRLAIVVFVVAPALACAAYAGTGIVRAAHETQTAQVELATARAEGELVATQAMAARKAEEEIARQKAAKERAAREAEIEAAAVKAAEEEAARLAAEEVALVADAGTAATISGTSGTSTGGGTSSPAPAPAPAPAPESPVVVTSYNVAIVRAINPNATYDSALSASCAAHAKKMALAGSIFHSGIDGRFESVGQMGGIGSGALLGWTAEIIGGFHAGHVSQLRTECTRVGVGVVTYKGVLWTVAQGVL